MRLFFTIEPFCSSQLLHSMTICTCSPVIPLLQTAKNAAQHKAFNYHATAARCQQRATNPLPAQGRFGTGGAEAGPLAVWASLLDRTSAARRSAPTGPDATVQTTPIYTQKPSNHHATAARCQQRATNPPPAQGRFGTDGAEAGPLAVWASLLDRTSAARRSAPTGPDATVQTQYRRYKKAPAAEGLFCIMRLKLIHQLSQRPL